MTVNVTKSSFNFREKLKELERPIGLKGNELMRAETAQDAFNLIGAGRRNILINSLFEVSQRGNYQVDNSGSAVTTTANVPRFAIDRWSFYSGVATTSASTQYVTLPTGEKVRSFKVTATSSAPNSWLHPMQAWEVQSWAEGQFFTLSCWVKTNRSGQRLRICDSVSCWEIGEEVPSDGQWHYMTATQQVGTNLNIGSAGQFQPAFTSGPVDNGHYVEFALPQMELGKVATPFEYRSYGEELALCQRYFLKLGGESAIMGMGSGTTTSTTQGWGVIQFPVTMRVPPTAALLGGTGVTISNGSSFPSSPTLGTQYAGTTGTMLTFNYVSPGYTGAGQGAVLYTQNGATDGLTFNAEF